MNAPDDRYNGYAANGIIRYRQPSRYDQPYCGAAFHSDPVGRKLYVRSLDPDLVWIYDELPGLVSHYEKIHAAQGRESPEAATSFIAATTRAFQLDDAQYDIIKRMLDDPSSFPDEKQTIQHFLHREWERAPAGVKLQLNPMYRQLLVVDTEGNVEEVARYLREVLPPSPDGMVERVFVVDPAIAKDMRVLLARELNNPLLMWVDDATRPRLSPRNDEIPQSHIIIIRDTLKNVEKAEKIITDPKIIDTLHRKLRKTRAKGGKPGE